MLAFIEDEALSRGLPSYSIGHVARFCPLIVIAIAGLIFGREVAGNAVSDQFGGLMGK